ncbi:MAG: MFS transporter, partial [Clostridia bacterium]|nr:MFS transporter [Clostridia bacterium]
FLNLMEKCLLVLAYLIYNFAHPKKIGWLMSLVDDHHRGSFTANKEIVSLIAGMLFTYSMGTLIDHFAVQGRIRTAFVLSAVVIFVLMVLHTLSMIFTIEPESAEVPKKNLRKSITDVLTCRPLLRIIVVFLLYQTAAGLASPFFGTYQINELDFDLQFISLLSIGSALVRIFVSRKWGKYADKTSFLNLMEKCLLVLAAALLSAALAVPSNGKLMFTLYYLFNGIAMGGLNSALINLVFDYAPSAQRADALAICQALSGVAGFLVTLGASFIVDAIQQNGNVLLGISVYAQQALSAAALMFVLLTLLYVRRISKRSA